MNWKDPAVQAIVESALREDAARDDITTGMLVDPSWRVHAVIRAHEPGVVCGLPLAALFLHRFDRRARFRPLVKDGDSVKINQVLATVDARARTVLSAERPALNALQHLSGIATYTRKQLKRMGKTRTRLLDTRKTLPGWRLLQKYAVRCGGADNHRLSLADAVLVKENHLRICRAAGADWIQRLQRARRRQSGLRVQVEVQSEQDLQDVLRLRPEMVLLDNMPIHRLRASMQRLRSQLPGVVIEISGGVRSEHLAALGRLGAERISMGRLTHSTQAFDCSLDILHARPR